MRFLRHLFLLAAGLLGLLCGHARADVPVTLYKSWAGQVNFTGTTVTQRTGRTVCEVYKANTKLSKALAGIPASATVLSAHLYWAGSGTTADNQVTFEGKTINAQRQYTSTYSTGGTSYTYFGRAADVTTYVQAKRNGTYTFQNLSVNSGSPYCGIEGVLGGFALLVVYSDASQPFRVLNLYEGFQYTRYSSITLNLSNFRTPNPLNGATGRIGHITWEGDLSLNQQGEDLKFNNTIMTDGTNPSGNQFNSRSNINGDNASYGVDFDAYTLSSPVIQPDQTTATTTYSSGQDMVLLQAEIVAVPNVPTADLAIAMTRTGEALEGADLTYTLTVSNNGPDQEPGTVTVTDTLPAGTTFVSWSGTGWSCAVAGATVTCTASGPVAKGVTLPQLRITARIPMGMVGGTFTNTAKVTGQRFDNVQPNNTASDTAVDSTLADAQYAFTDAPCTSGVAIATDPNAPGCHRYVGPYVAGKTQGLYITALVGGIPRMLHQNQVRTRTMRFALTCTDPVATAGVAPTFGTLTLKTCAPRSATLDAQSTYWSTNSLDVYFPAGSPSGRLSSTTPLNFVYRDVGMVKLNLLESGNIVSTSFISVPDKVSFNAIRNSDGGIITPGNQTSSANGFAKVSEPFTVEIRVAISGGGAAPNFGKERTPYGPVQVALGQPEGTPRMSATFGTQVGGVYSASTAYGALGEVNLTPLISGQTNPDTGVPYYPVGTYFGVPVATEVATKVGKFYPAYYETYAKTLMGCQPRMGCPDSEATLPPNGEALEVDGSVYSGQPFTAGVRIYDWKGAEIDSPNAFKITLTPYGKPGSTGALLSTLAATQNEIPMEATETNPILRLPIPYKTDEPRRPPPLPAWSAPVSVYMRATTPMTRVIAGGTRSDPISSNRGANVKSVEGGVQLVNGRLRVGNVFGVDSLKLRIPLTSQYWTGTSWDDNPDDNDSSIVPVNTAPTFTKCKKYLALDASGTCKAVVAWDSTAAVVTENGIAWVRLRSPGVGNSGSVQIRMPNAPAWLPSTVGQATYGLYKSPLIYVREVY